MKINGRNWKKQGASMSNKIKFIQMLKKHGEIYSSYEQPKPEMVEAMAKSLHNQSYQKEKLEHALSEISRNAGRKFPSINEIKMAGNTWRPSASKEINDNEANKNTKMYREYFVSTLEAVGKETYVKYLYAYMKKVFNDSDAAKSIAIDFDTATLDQIFNSLLNRLALRHLRMAKGNT